MRGGGPKKNFDAANDGMMNDHNNHKSSYGEKGKTIK